jgi:hypothetical protein
MEKKYEEVKTAIFAMAEAEALELVARLRAEFRPETHPGGVRLVEPGRYGWATDQSYHSRTAWLAVREAEREQAWEAAKRAADCAYARLMAGDWDPAQYRAWVTVQAFLDLAGYAKAYRGIEGLSREDSEGARISRGNEWIRLEAIGRGEGLEKVRGLLGLATTT